MASNGLSPRCVGCGDRIPPERLEVLPDTRHCVNCSEALGIVRPYDDRVLPPDQEACELINSSYQNGNR